MFYCPLREMIYLPIAVLYSFIPFWITKLNVGEYNEVAQVFFPAVEYNSIDDLQSNVYN